VVACCASVKEEPHTPTTLSRTVQDGPVAVGSVHGQREQHHGCLDRVGQKLGVGVGVGVGFGEIIFD